MFYPHAERLEADGSCLERPGTGGAAFRGGARQHTLSDTTTQHRVRLRGAGIQAAFRCLSAVPDLAVLLADEVASDVVGDDLDCVGVRELVVAAPSLEDLFVGLTGEGFDVER